MSRPTYNHLPTNLKNRYVIARHGFSLANNAGLICSDPAIAIPEAEGPLGTGWGLHDRGKEQVKASASLLVKHLTSKGSPLTDESIVIFCSPFLRTRQTAEIFRSTLNETLSLNIAPATPNLSLRERFYGDYDMKSDENYKTCWADDATGPDHGEHSSSGVESPSSVCDRTTQFILDEIENKVQGKVVLLVAHGDVCQIMQTAFLSMEAYRHREVEHVETASWREMEA
ncbi:histidine phosphatase superfamily [Radiomyces spectabilis]|uniref:histidine phosphatase superfamily n=1 Tax=Radiomyces spectabilis TaxID=64574 RepID=UPI0022204356|nr:histidine phosphatase superfamily [Radiomyces spectabilis]KAI8388646.1 histidine phosphatase superfamily [Radiomyces spectabilis]